MSIDSKVKELDVKRVLVVDDSQENIDAAKRYFQNFENVRFDYCVSGKEAINSIKKESERSQNYDLIMSDLEMETKEAGLDVIKQGFLNHTLGVIVTGKDYDRDDNHAHGPATTVLPTRYSVSGRKDKEKVWSELFNNALDYLKEKKPLRESIERNKKYVGKMDEGITDLFMELYK